MPKQFPFHSVRNQEMYDRRREWTVKKHAAYDHISTGTIGPIRDESGNILPNGKFPDMKAMTGYIHSHGLKAGIFSSPGARTCQEWAGSYGHESADADVLNINQDELGHTAEVIRNAT